MKVYKRGNSWYIDIIIQGRRIRESVGPKKGKALEALAMRKAEILEGRFNIPTFRRVRFDLFAEQYMQHARATKKSWLRDEGLLKNLIPYFGKDQLGNVSSEKIEKYRIERLKKVKPATVNREVALLKHMFSLAIKWKKATVNPVKEVKLLHEDNIPERILSREEEAKLLEACSDYSRPVVLTALLTGMRKGEILSLKWDQVNLEERVIAILNSKNGKRREIPINDTLFLTLKALKKASSSDYVFTYPQTNQPPKEFKVAWQHALQKSGIKKCRFHDLRHTFASHLVSEGVDLVTVKDLLGHSTITMTTRYAHSAPLAKVVAVGKLNKRFLEIKWHNPVTIPETRKVLNSQVIAK